MVLGFQLALPEHQDVKKPYILLRYFDQRYLVEMGDTPNGNARRVINALQGFQKICDKDKESLDKAVTRKAELKKLVSTPDDTYERKLAECEKDAEQLRSIIAIREESPKTRPQPPKNG